MRSMPLHRTPATHLGQNLLGRQGVRRRVGDHTDACTLPYPARSRETIKLCEVPDYTLWLPVCCWCGWWEL